METAVLQIPTPAEIPESLLFAEVELMETSPLTTALYSAATLGRFSLQKWN